MTDLRAALEANEAKDRYIKQLELEIERMRSDREYVIGWNDGFEHALKEAATVADGHSDRIGDLIRRLKEEP